MNINKTLQQKVNDLLSQISVGNKVRFGSKSQKGIKKNVTPVQDKDKDKDDFDGTNGAAMSSASQTDTASADADPEPAEQAQKSYENRIGLKYQTMNADNRIVHESDVNLLPEGSTVIKSVYESTYEQVSYIVQHDYEMIIYKDKDGVMRKGYFPKAEESAEIDRIPGTHASCSLLANLVFNKYHMNTPVYREMVRLLNNKMNVSRNTVYNWFVKGSEYLNKVLPILKEKLLAKGAVVNCDDNSHAERTLRPMTVECKRSSLSRLLPKGRKNSLTFGSHAGAKVSVIYHTFIETCKMCGVSTLEYFKEFFKAAIKRVQFRIHSRIVESEQVRLIIKAIMQGRTDYERSAMPLATIGTQEHVTDDHRY